MAVLVRKAGVFTSLQGLGRYGQQRYGVAPGGSMDRTAARIANILAGNDESEHLLEFHFPGPEIVFGEDRVFALGGADFDARLDGEPVRNWHRHLARASGVLSFKKKLGGSRGYLAVDGGLRYDNARSESPFVTERISSGQTLIAIKDSQAEIAGRLGVARDLLPAYSEHPTVRLIAGAESDSLTAECLGILKTSDFTLTKDSDRMGFRLHGPILQAVERPQMVSAAVCFGTVQLLPNGQLIVLMADHQASGGYPRIGHVIAADLPLVAQLGPGDAMRFSIVDIGVAEQAAARIESDLNKLKAGLSLGRYR